MWYHLGMGHRKVTSRRVATEAAKALRDKNSTAAKKRIAASALSQAAGKHKRRRS